MLPSFLKTALRNLLKRNGYAALNILGLVIGITGCLLIFQYVSYQRSYDTFQQRSPQIFRLRLDQYKQGQLSWQSATSYPAIGPALKKEYAEVEDYCRLIDWNGILVNPATNMKFNETKGYYADPSVIDMLSLHLLRGDPRKAMISPDNIIISEAMSKKYFGSADPIGKRLEIRAGTAPPNQAYLVTGVFRDYPPNSHLIINFLVSYASLEAELKTRGDTTNAANTSFGWYDFYTYLQLKQGTDYKQFEKKLTVFCDRHINNLDWNRTNSVKDWLYLIPLSDIHLYSNYNQEAEVNGSGQAVAFLFLIAFFILGIAWINYINLATARSIERAKEVGIRKVLGAVKSDLVRQFMLESLFMNIIALLIAVIAADLITPFFNNMMGEYEGAGFSITEKYTLLFAGIFLTGTIISGMYPAFVLSGYRPIVVLKGVFKNSSGGLMLRKGLIILQFSISVMLIVGTIIVFQQVNYMRNQQLGANISQTLVLNGAQSLSDSLYQNTFQPFKDELLKIPGVQGIAASSTVMGQEIYWTRGVKALQNQRSSTAVTLYLLGVDYDFIPQFQLKLIAGRNFSKDYPVDANGKTAILNEQAVQTLGFRNPEDAIGKKIIVGGSDTLSITGIVQSFHHLGLQKPIEPELILFAPNTRDNYSIKLQSGDLQHQIAAVEKVWNHFFPDDPFSYFFLEDFYNQQYKSDQQFGNVFTIFAFLAIIIACFGLLGLSSYNILQRTKEIGIRKVLGASNGNVVYILSKDFLFLVVISFLFALPASWWVMHEWLQGYAYRISIHWWVFMAGCLISSLIALLTIGAQTIKAAFANPVMSLRSE